MLQGDTKPIRRLVESRFDDIKAVTEGTSPVLPVETSTWCEPWRSRRAPCGHPSGAVSLCVRREHAAAAPLTPPLMCATTAGGRLQSITWVCREEVAAFPAYIHKRVAPLVQLATGDVQQQCMRSCSRGGGSSRPASSVGGAGGTPGARPAPGQLVARQQQQQQQQSQQQKPQPQQQGPHQHQQPPQQHYCQAQVSQNFHQPPQVQRAC